MLFIFALERDVRPRENDDGVLQPLGGVHRDDLHRVLTAALGIFQGVVACAQTGKKGVDVCVPPLRDQTAHARKARPAALLRRDLRLQPESQQLVHDLRRRAEAGVYAKLLGAGAEGCELAGDGIIRLLPFKRRARRAEGHARLRPPPGTVQPHLCEVALGQPADGGQQRAAIGNILLAVVQIGEPVEEQTHFKEVADIDLRRSAEGNAPREQGAGDVRRLSLVAAGEYRDVRKAHPAHRLRVRIEPLAAQLRFDDADDLIRARVLFLRARPVQDGIDRARLFAPGFLLGKIIVPDLPGMLLVALPAAHGDILRQKRGKDEVDRLQHGGRRAEVGGEPQRSGKRPLLFLEELRAAAAEAVDRLLGVADEEHLAAAETGEDRLLHGIDVLIFVHEHRPVLAGEVGADDVVLQKVQRDLLEIVVVEHARFPLFLHIGRVIRKRKPAERLLDGIRLQIARPLRLAVGIFFKLLE